MQQVFSNCIVGLSDHTMGVGASIASVVLGARVIEKHFTLRRADGGVDSAFSLEPQEMKSLVEETERAYLALGRPYFDIQQVETKSKIFKRSIYVSKAVSAGDAFTKENLRVIRPGHGLPSKFFDQVIGKKSIANLPAGTPLSWDHIF
jgi:sialic acid synthase SpsE